MTGNLCLGRSILRTHSRRCTLQLMREGVQVRAQCSHSGFRSLVCPLFSPSATLSPLTGHKVEGVQFSVCVCVFECLISSPVLQEVPWSGSPGDFFLLEKWNMTPGSLHITSLSNLCSCTSPFQSSPNPFHVHLPPSSFPLLRVSLLAFYKSSFSAPPIPPKLFSLLYISHILSYIHIFLSPPLLSFTVLLASATCVWFSSRKQVVSVEWWLLFIFMFDYLCPEFVVESKTELQERLIHRTFRRPEAEIAASLITR